MREQSGSSWARTRAVVLGVIAAVLVSLVATSMVAAPASAAEAPQARAASAPVVENEFGKIKSRVVGTFGKAGTVDGAFKPKRFKAVGDQLVVVGKLKADLVKRNGKVLDTISEKVSLPVVAAGGSTLARADCDILNLVLGPLDLDILGLTVHLDKVVLDIVAVSGAGNLLGNLLCAVAGLLDQGGLLVQISQILNAILALLQQ